MGPEPHLEPIPRPPGHMLVGNLFDIDTAHPIEGLAELARKYGPIYELDVPGRGSRIIASSFELVDPLCDESSFDKKVGGGLSALASGPAGRGLFTSETQDPNWRKAHNVLLPAFSMDAMRGYHPRMLDIATQLMLKWERLNADDTVGVPADMTRLTLDTIALCGFDYRFNSFYRDTAHPFVLAMLNTLETAQAVARELPIQGKLKPGRAKKVRADQEFMAATVRHIIEERRKSGALGQVNDLLDRMLTGVDHQSGEKLDETNIIAQCITFLIAGHETTSGLLSFALYALIKNPKVLEGAYEEVDRVLGADVNALPTYAQTHQLPYVSQILEETLRLWPTAPAFTRRPYKDTVLGGKYKVEADSAVVVLTGMLHRDPKIWGDNPEAFDPDRFSDENRAKIPPNAYKPFGTGQRACIGRQFALQEATLVLAMLLQRFEFVDFANYQLETKQTLTIKPANFIIHVKRRPGHTTTGFFAAPRDATTPTTVPAASAPSPASTAATQPAAAGDAHATPLLVLFGSNLGTAEGIAHRIADDARSRGFAATVGAVDEYADALPKQGAVVIVTASYNGQPPDNATKFCQKLRDPALPSDAFAGVEYGVFGCGNRDWSATYQAIPTLIDAELEKHGGKRIYKRGEGDARSDFDRDYRTWYGDLFPSLAKALDLPAATAEAKMAGPRISVSFVNRLAASPIMRSYSAVAMTVRMNRVAATRLRMFRTVCASHRPPRAVAIPRPLRAAAIWRSDFAPYGLSLADSWHDGVGVRACPGLKGRRGRRRGPQASRPALGPWRRPERPSCAGRSARGVQAQQERLNVRPQPGDEVLCAKGASGSESDGGTRLSFPSINQGREVFQPNAGLCERRASLRARLRGPCLAECRSSRAPPPCSSRPFLPISALFMTTRIASMEYLASLTGMRRLAFADARPG